jgi:hypothetical protein
MNASPQPIHFVMHRAPPSSSTRADSALQGKRLEVRHTLVGMTENDTPLPSVFTRQELYDLVWSEPVQSLAKRLSISDRGLAKVCVAANIPVPARGYWAKLQAGRRATRFPLPDRAFGQSDTVPVRRNRWG